ncbi:MAG: hypothetical protein DME25_01540 [Verrucomicrobia bacterium]|nr:MAG: hypothetical protein DME25_01540 [Verrucomicrobiota bacterium]
MLMQRLFMLLGGMGVVLLTGGCASLFPTDRATTESRWKAYPDVEAAFDQIKTNETTAAELKLLGFDPAASPNLKILTYVDIIQRFMPNQGIRMEDLHPAVRACIEAKEQSRAFELVLKEMKSKRHGNLFLDVLGFKRLTHDTGWEFNGLILLKNDVVVYKLTSGEPAVSREAKRVRPLGPLQELEGSFASVFKVR